MIKNKNLIIRPVDKNNWSDFETLFESKGSPHYCWCMAWRMTGEERKNNTTENRKKFIKQRVMSKTPIGLIGYINQEAIAWCSIAPRETYRSLGGDENLENVWSIVCFFVKKEYQRGRMATIFIESAKDYAKKNGAKYIEAYPVEKKSPSYRFMGFISMFEKAGFIFIKKAGARRNVMTYKL
ncbi:MULTISPECIES: GNAT family N-acetyltransferase [Leptospira]|uniref:GNAT family N-acetyltransferase n=1 Tax=Leptospira TaxID=171 RepID=UPI0002BF05F0|nr:MULTISPECIES: GNAT family N-acetyltransferase [Leptospira]EMJ87194.1 acetyltransferase, GNAT family [Leptospira kirschneri str. JB]EMK05335.1 acetyltransferase, GNAT family [Leptospira kirschneri]KXZ26579.1 acetyltransferase [Leptospira kirschneri]KXZ33731.1 acetyltransferase [Leptospira sp. ZV016]